MTFLFLLGFVISARQGDGTDARFFLVAFILMSVLAGVGRLLGM